MFIKTALPSVMMLVATTSCGSPENPPANSTPPATTSSASPATTNALPVQAAPVTPAPTPPSPLPVKPSATSTPQAGAGKTSGPDAELKIDSQLLVEIHRLQGKPAPTDKTGVKIDADKRALVDVRAIVTPELQKVIVSAGGTIVSTSVRDHSILAWVPLLKIESVAGDPAVRAIVPAAQSIIR